MLEAGTDPIDARKAERALIAPKRAFRAVAEDCIASLVPGWTNSKSEGQWRQSLTTYAYPVPGDMDVRHIDTDDVYQVSEPIWANKPETAGRFRSSSTTR